MIFKFETDARELEARDGLVWLAEVEVPSDPLTRFRVTSDNEPLYYGESLEGVAVVPIVNSSRIMAPVLAVWFVKSVSPPIVMPSPAVR